MHLIIYQVCIEIIIFVFLETCDIFFYIIIGNKESDKANKHENAILYIY